MSVDQLHTAGPTSLGEARGALVGIDSFTEEGLQAASKLWSPLGQEAIEAIRIIQENGIMVLASIICGLECDTVATLKTMRSFAVASKSLLAQFTVYRPYPGTKDYYEMIKDMKNSSQPGYVPKHKTRIVTDRFWLTPQEPVNWFKHANLSRDELLRENKRSWDSFYSLRHILGRTGSGLAKSWSLGGRLAYAILCLAWNRIYSGHGISADSVQRNKSLPTRMLINAGVAVYNHYYRQTKLDYRIASFHPDLAASSPAGRRPPK